MKPNFKAILSVFAGACIITASLCGCSQNGTQNGTSRAPGNNMGQGTQNNRYGMVNATTQNYNGYSYFGNGGNNTNQTGLRNGSNTGMNGTNGTNGNGLFGMNGTNGTNGTDGNGLFGMNGTNGTNGTSRMNGANGTNGTNGNGLFGMNGTNGTNGTNGNGLFGMNGTNGTNGTSGMNGTSGTNGMTNGSSGMNGTLNQQAANSIKTQLRGVKGISNVNCMVLGNTALVSYKCNNNTAALQNSIKQKVKSADSSITNVYCTNDSSIVTRMSRLSSNNGTNNMNNNGTNNGVVNNIATEFNNIIRSLTQPTR